MAHHLKDLAVDLADRPGTVASLGEALGKAGVNIDGISGVQAGGKGTVHILVDDDGPGLSPQQREQVARRGRRLDETKPGSGLGLSIVVELASLYGGGLTLGTAPIGGLRAELLLPAA